MESCPRPLHAFPTGSKTRSGADEYIIKSNDVEWVNIIPVGRTEPITLADYIELPCGKCEVCKANQANKKALRAMCEAQSHKENIVINLTYNDNNMPRNSDGRGTLKYKDVQDFKKRLLKHWKTKYGATEIKFLCACEYGSNYARPHYHMIMFNMEAPDKYYWGDTKKGSREFRSPEIEKLWGKGYVTIGDVTSETISYVANYCLKKFKGREAKGHYLKLGIEPEKVTSSNRRGLGATFAEDKLEQYITTGNIYVGSSNGALKVGPNAYFDKMIAEKYGDDLLKNIKKRRIETMNEREETRAKLSNMTKETLRDIKYKQFLERIQKAKNHRAFKETSQA